MKKLFFTLCVISTNFLLTNSGTCASVALTYEFDSLRNTSGSALSSPYVLIFVADSNGDGFFPTANSLSGIPLTNGGTIAGDKIFEVKVTTAGSLGFQAPSGSITVDFTTNSLNELGGTKWSIYWFPAITAADTVLTVGTKYGYYHSPVRDAAAVTAFGNTAYSGMVFPASGTPTTEVGFFDTTIISAESVLPTVNTPTVSNFTASLTVVPEPSTFLLSAFGALALLRRSRKG
jgi:hypothetical protein